MGDTVKEGGLVAASLGAKLLLKLGEPCIDVTTCGYGGR